MLHRIVTEEPSDAGAEIGPNPDRKRALRAAGQARGKLKEVQKLLASIASEVQGDRYWRYQRNVSPGLQEYIEALSFAHYLETGKLVTFNEVQLSISDEHGVPVGTSQRHCYAYSFAIVSSAVFPSLSGGLLAGPI